MGGDGVKDRWTQERQAQERERTAPGINCTVDAVLVQYSNKYNTVQ
jgi:hypothetical protein